MDMPMMAAMGLFPLVFGLILARPDHLPNWPCNAPRQRRRTDS